MKKEEKKANKEITKFIKKISEKYSSVRVADTENVDREYISTGLLALDLCLNGGIAWGYVSEFSGFSGSGKTTIMQKMLACAQRDYNAWGLWLDREAAWSNDRAEMLGVDLSKVIVIDPIDIITVPDATQMLDTVLKTFPSDSYRFIVIDSLSAFSDTAKIEKADMGKKAQSLHRLFRTVIPVMDKKVSLNFSNHRTYKLDILFGDKTTTTGGEGPKFYSNYRIRLDDKKGIVDSKRNDEIIGNWIEALIIKTRLGPAFRKIVFPHFYKEGIPYYGGYARLLVNRNYLKPANVKQFNSFNQKTVKYKDKRFSEFDIERKLKEFPELLFDKYPEWCEES